MSTPERTPQPNKTTSGAEGGATLDLTIGWYKADRATPAHGILQGSDAGGEWKLEFATPAELKKQLASIVSELEAVALASRNAEEG
jgi:hypothetical protein